MKVVKRNGFREQFMLMKPTLNVPVGIRLLILVVGLFVANVAAATIDPLMSYANAGVALAFDKSGLEGDELKLVEKLEARAKKFPESMTKEMVVTEVRAAFKDFLDENGKAKFDVDKLAELLDDKEDGTGIRAILKKQGEDIAAMKEKNGNLPKSFRAVLNDQMGKIEEIFKNGKNSKEEHAFDVRAAAPMTLDNTIDDTAMPDDLIESFSLGKFVGKRYPREYVFDMASRTTVAKIAQYKSWLEEGDEEGAFAIVAEGGLKPLVSYALVRNVSEYSKVAAKHVVTEEFAKFRAEAYTIIKRLISQKILRDYAAILTTRLLADAVAYTGSALDDQYLAANVTDYHAIAAVAAQIEALDFMPDMLIINPQDKWRIGMAQATDGHFYLTIPMTDPTGNTRLMGFVVRTSNRIAVGNFMLGESGLWEIEDETLTIRSGYGVTVTGSNPVTAVESDLDHNRFRVIVETYFHSYIATNNIGSFVYANYAAVKALVEAP